MRAKLLLVTVLFLTAVSGWASGSQEDEKTIIRMAHFYDSMGDANSQISIQWLENMKADFESENPECKIEFEQMKWDEIDVKMMSDYRAGITSHDLTLVSPQMIPQHALVGDLADISSFIEEDWSSEELGEFSWAATWTKMEQNGKRLGVPLGNHSRLVLYNKKMFNAAGLNPEKPPKTMDEMIEMAKLMTLDTDGDGEIDQYGLGVALGADRATVEVTFAPILWGLGGRLWDPTNKEASFANEEGIKTAEILYDMINDSGIVSPSAVVKDYSRNIYDSVLQEDVAIALGWGSYWTAALEDKGLIEGLFPPTDNGKMTEVGVFPYPTSVQAGFTNCWALSIYEKSENKDAAWKLMNHILKAEYLKTYPDAGLPMRKSEWENSEYKTPFYQAFYEAIEKGRPMPSTAHYGELSDNLFSALQQIMNGNKSEIPTILEVAQNQFNSKYKGE